MAMVSILFMTDAPDAQSALLGFLRQHGEVAAEDVIIDPLWLEEEGIRFHRWLAVGGAAFEYPDSLVEADGSLSSIKRMTDGGYLTEDGEGRWAILDLDSSVHMLEEAASLLLTVSSDWGRYED